MFITAYFLHRHQNYKYINAMLIFDVNMTLLAYFVYKMLSKHIQNKNADTIC